MAVSGRNGAWGERAGGLGTQGSIPPCPRRRLLIFFFVFIYSFRGARGLPVVLRSLPVALYRRREHWGGSETFSFVPGSAELVLRSFRCSL